MTVAGRVTQPPVSGIQVPDTAFVDDTDTSVQIVSDGLVTTVPVTLAAQDDKSAIVLGLRPGLKVIVNGQLGLADGQQVTPLLGRHTGER